MKKKKISTKKTKKSAPSKKASVLKKSAKPQPKGIPHYGNYEKVLLKKRMEIMRTVKNKEADITLGEIGDELDQASQTFEREMIYEMTNGERAILDDIEAALRKMEKGNFGNCELCRARIGSPRLKAMPWARYCIVCQSKAEGRR